MSFHISQTPFRMSFFGGGTDYPEWYRKHGGAVLSTTINKYCYISCRYLPPFFDIRHRIVWSHIETVNSIAEILHPAVREGLRFLGYDDSKGVELHYQGDLPARAGTGSSSAFAVGLIKALKSLRGETIDGLPLAQAAITLERERLREAVGAQDQVASAVGGLNVIRFQTDGEIDVQKLAISKNRLDALDDRLMLFFTGSTRLGTDLARKIIDDLDNHQRELTTMTAMVSEAVRILQSDGSLDPFGQLLHEAWLLKQRLADEISGERINLLYQAARTAGALGGKLMGAGRSGFLLLYAPQERQAAVRSALASLLEVPFRFETHGSRIMHKPPLDHAGDIHG